MIEASPGPAQHKHTVAVAGQKEDLNEWDLVSFQKGRVTWAWLWSLPPTLTAGLTEGLGVLCSVTPPSKEKNSRGLSWRKEPGVVDTRSSLPRRPPRWHG